MEKSSIQLNQKQVCNLSHELMKLEFITRKADFLDLTQILLQKIVASAKIRTRDLSTKITDFRFWPSPFAQAYKIINPKSLFGTNKK